jgi:hypothetical protein
MIKEIAGDPMIETKNDQITDQQIKEYLRDTMPWLAVDANVSMLRGCAIQNIASEIARREGSLVITPEFQNAWREHLSIYMDAEDGFAFRKAFFEKKKAADESVEAEKLRSRLRHFRVVDSIGQRLDVDKLNLPELRRHVAEIDTNRRNQTLTADQLRAEERAKNPPPVHRADGFARMPRYLVVPEGVRVADIISDGIHAIEMSPAVVRAFIKAPLTSDAYHYFRFRMCRLFGMQQLQDRSRG